MMLSRIETKVYAGVAGALAGVGAFTPTALWLLGVYAFHGSTTAANADATIAGVPWPITLAVTTILGGGTTALAAYKAPPSDHAGNAVMDDSDAGHPADVPTEEDDS